MPREGRAQAARRSVANDISKKWKIARQDKRTRGLVNEGNNCYRHGAFQPLHHLPRFVNWILQHNKYGQNWPCHANDPNRPLTGLDAITQGILQDTSYKNMTKEQRAKYNKRPNGATIRCEDLKDHDPNLYSGCVPCLLKRLIQGYWGSILIGYPGHPQRPEAFPHDHHVIFALHQWAQQKFCVDLPGHTDDDFPPSAAEIDRPTRVARRNNMTGQ